MLSGKIPAAKDRGLGAANHDGVNEPIALCLQNFIQLKNNLHASVNKACHCVFVLAETEILGALEPSVSILNG